MLTSILALLTSLPQIESEASAGIKLLQDFLATPIGQELETQLATVFTATSTPGTAVVVEPKSWANRA